MPPMSFRRWDWVKPPQSFWRWPRPSHQSSAVRRLKNDIAGVHPLQGDELRALRRLHIRQEPKSTCVVTLRARHTNEPV
jgi:hypothetical protein